MTTLKVLTQQMKLDTTGVTEIFVAHCFKCLNRVMQRTTHLQFSSLLFTCRSAMSLKLPSPSVFQSFSGSPFPLFLFHCSCNLTLANTNTIVRAGCQGKSPCIYISVFFEHHDMDSHDSQEGLSTHSSHGCCP